LVGVVTQAESGRCVFCVQSNDSVFSSAEFVVIGGVGFEKLGDRCSRREAARLESILRHGSTLNRGLRNASAIGIFLFMVSQWRQPTRNVDAIPWALEILWQDCCVRTRREHRLERLREGQMEAVDSRLGSVLSFCCVRNLYVGLGLNGAFS
jgi:hypothetical protein